MATRILTIDDDTQITGLLSRYLEKLGYEARAAIQGREGLRLAYEYHPDLVLLDLMMPEVDGWEVARRLREVSDVPIMVLSARTSEQDVVSAFQLGADDYVRKPFILSELAERIRAVLRRSRAREPELLPVYSDGCLSLDLGRRLLSRRGEAIHLTPTEFRLLAVLLRHMGSVVPHSELLRQVWGPGYSDAGSCLSLYIRYLRAKLEDDPGEPAHIRTEWGVGYRFVPSDAALAA